MIYDLIVIGGGPAGYHGALLAGRAGLQTLLVEARALGGVCLNEGCIPSKSLLYSAKIYDQARQGEKYGVKVTDISLNHTTVIERKNKVVKTLVAGIKSQYKNLPVTLLDDRAVITGRNRDGYEIRTGNGETYTGKRLLITTGSAPIIPPIPGVEEGISRGDILTNREILDLKTVPSSLVIVGGGVIGLEMASYYNSAGSKVTVIEMLDRIGGNIDRQIAEILLKNYQKKGITFHLASKVTAVKPGEVVYETNGTAAVVSAEKVLLSVGRRPVTKELGLESIGVQLERGAIVTDATGQTNQPGVYAAGDVNGFSMLAHTAYREAEVCINNMLGIPDRMRYDAVPGVIYTNPEVAGVGETEESARQKGIQFDMANLSLRYSGRYLAENEGGDGICKVLVEKQTRKLIGVHLIGSYASEIIYGAAAMIETELRVKEIKEIVFPHPSVAEVIREGIFELD